MIIEIRAPVTSVTLYIIYRLIILAVSVISDEHANAVAPFIFQILFSNNSVKQATLKETTCSNRHLF